MLRLGVTVLRLGVEVCLGIEVLRLGIVETSQEGSRVRPSVGTSA